MPVASAGASGSRPQPTPEITLACVSDVKRVFGSALLHVPHPHHAPPRTGAGSVNPTAVLALSCGILFLIAINTTAINTALNAIAEDLDMGTSELSWAVGIYMLSVAAFVVLGGRLGDMFGELRMVVVGLLVFAIAALLVAAAQDAPMAILGRALQGAGSAALMPASMAVLRLAYPPERQGFALGIWGATGGLGFAIGPLIGGAITDLVDWRWIWWGSVIAAVALASTRDRTLRAMPRPTERPQIDRPGVVLLPVALFALILAIQQAPTWGGDPSRRLRRLPSARSRSRRWWWWSCERASETRRRCSTSRCCAFPRSPPRTWARA